MLRFDLTPKQNVLLEEIITVDRNAIASQADLMHNKGGGFGGNVHESNDECNGMLRIWDGPLREVPTCSDLNWCDYLVRVDEEKIHFTITILTASAKANLYPNTVKT